MSQRIRPERAPFHSCTSVEEPDEEVIEAMRTADADQTILVIEARGLPIEHLAAYGAGWQVHVEDLAAHAPGVSAATSRARWDELIAAYQELAANVD